MKSKYLIIVFIALFFISCDKSGTNPDNASTVLWPLAVGNTWTYYVYNVHSTAKDSILLPDTITLTVSEKYTLVGEEWYSLSPNGNKPEVIFTNRKDGLWRCAIKDSGNIKNGLAELYYRYPTFLNEKYPTDTSGQLTASMNTSVNSPSGSFSCIKYINIKNRDEYFFRPGIGFIKSEHITHIDNTKPIPDTIWIRMLLASYKLNK